MSHTVKFIHAADLHLGAAFKGLVSSSEMVGRRLAEAIPRTLVRIVDTCIDEDVDFLILSGDTFNAGEAPYRVEHGFIEQMRRLADRGIPVFICTGNHDPLPTWELRRPVLPENVHLFAADRPEYLPVDGGDGPSALLAGRSYASSEQREDLTPGLDRRSALAAAGPAPFVIGVLHTGITDPRYAPCRSESLTQSGFDYYALGHIHEQGVAGSLPVMYAGTPQGLDINEPPEHGCLLVTLDENRAPSIERVDTAQVVWERARLDISQLRDSEELSERLVELGRAIIARYGKPVCMRFYLIGEGPVHRFLTYTPDVEAMAEDVSQTCSNGTLWLWVDRIVDWTGAPIDLAALAAEGLFPAALIERFEELEGDPDDAKRLIDDALSAAQVPPYARRINIPGVMEGARSLALDLLMGGAR